MDRDSSRTPLLAAAVAPADPPISVSLRRPSHSHSHGESAADVPLGSSVSRRGSAVSPRATSASVSAGDAPLVSVKRSHSASVTSAPAAAASPSPADNNKPHHPHHHHHHHRRHHHQHSAEVRAAARRRARLDAIKLKYQTILERRNSLRYKLFMLLNGTLPSACNHWVVKFEINCMELQCFSYDSTLCCDAPTRRPRPDRSLHPTVSGYVDCVQHIAVCVLHRKRVLQR
jgi:hypothetical protein